MAVVVAILAPSLIGWLGTLPRPGTRTGGLLAARPLPRVTAPADTATLDYIVSGVHVIQRLTPATEVVAAQLYLQGGVQQVTASTAGIEEMALRTSDYGTRQFPATNSRRAFARTGSQWLLDPSTDWTMVGFVGVIDQFDSSWSVFADRITHPIYDSAGMTVVRQQMVREARLRSITPDGIAHHIADSMTFAGHPYALNPSGTEASLATLTAAAVRRYVTDEFVTSRMLLVVVGNISRQHLEPLVASSLGTLPAGSYVWSPPMAVPRHPSSMALVPRNIATNYILGYFAGPAVESPDYPAFQLATELLSARIQDAVRYRSSLSYAAFAPFVGRAIAAGGIYASTAAPVAVVGIMREQVAAMKNEPIPGAALDQLVKQSVNAFIVENETNTSQASALARAQLLQGDYHRAGARLDALRHVSPDDVSRVAQTYMRDIQFVYVGDTTQVRREWVNSM
jgi:zinc protease